MPTIAETLTDYTFADFLKKRLEGIMTFYVAESNISGKWIRYT